MRLATFRTDMAKQGRRARTYVALGVMAGLPILMTFAFKYGGRGERGDRDPTELFRLARQSGVVVPAAALAALSGFFLIIVVAVFSGDAVASEASWGNLRYLLVRPVSRARLLAGKTVVAFLLAWIATVSISLVGLAAGTIAFGLHPIDVPLIVHQSVGQLLSHLVVVTAYIAWSMSAVVAFGVMLSTMTDAPAGAIFAAAGFGIVAEILDAIQPLGFLRYGLPLHYLNAWTDFFRPTNSIIGGASASFARAEMWRGVAVQVPYVVVFLAVAFWWFGRKDVLS